MCPGAFYFLLSSQHLQLIKNHPPVWGFPMTKRQFSEPLAFSQAGWSSWELILSSPWQGHRLCWETPCGSSWHVGLASGSHCCQADLKMWGVGYPGRYWPVWRVTSHLYPRSGQRCSPLGLGEHQLLSSPQLHHSPQCCFFWNERELGSFHSGCLATLIRVSCISPAFTIYFQVDSAGLIHPQACVCCSPGSTKWEVEGGLPMVTVILKKGHCGCCGQLRKHAQRPYRNLFLNLSRIWT